MHLNRVALSVLAGAFILTCVDISGDYVVVFGVALNKLVPSNQNIIKSIVTGLVAILATVAIIRFAINGNRVRLSRSSVTFLILLAAAVIQGVTVGMLNRIRLDYLIGDTRNYFVLFGLFGLVGVKANVVIRRVRWALLVGTGVLVGKLVLSVIGEIVLGFPLSARYFLKSGPIFLPVLFMCFSVVIDPRQDSEWKWNRAFFILSLLGMLLANTRGYFLGAVGGALTICFCLRVSRKAFRRVGLILITVVGIGLVLAIVSRGDAGSVFGTWNGANFEFGLNYRFRQVQSLMAMFAQNPLFGAGLGAFDPTYEGYINGLPRPYIVELEFINLLAKLGIVGFAFFALSYVFLIVRGVSLAWRTVNPKQRSMVVGLTCGLVALMVAGMTNSVYSSLQFHLYQLMVLAVFEGVAQQEWLQTSTAHELEARPS